MKPKMINTKRAIPWAFNMSFGLISAILCMLLSEFIPDPYALYSCAAVSLTYSFASYYLSGKKVYNFIAYLTSGALCLLAFSTLLPIEMFPKGTIPFTLELVVIVFTFLLFYGQSILKKIFNKNNCSHCDNLVSKSLDLCIVSARIILIMGVLHFAAVTLFLLINHPLSQINATILYQILPAVIFVACIGINQVGIYFANRVINTEEEIPVVDEQGSIVGKRFKVEAPVYKDAYINPVIRIAYIYNGMLYLCHRENTSLLDKNKIDIPMETYLQFGETLEDGVNRLLAKAYPEGSPLTPRFSIKHHFKNEDTNRLIYLYIAYITDEELLCNPYYKGGKLWTFQQIEQNLGKEYFSECFENEYEHLKTAVSIWEAFG